MLKTDKERLSEVMEAFYKLTGVKVAIYNTDFEEAVAYPVQNSEFCTLMYSDARTARCCNENTSELLKRCLDSPGKTVMHTCHAGLTEVATVISDGETVIGYIIFGQITNISLEDEFVDSVKEKCKKYFIDEAAIDEHIRKIKYIDEERLESISLLLGMTVSYIIANRLAYSDVESMGLEIKEYIKKNISKGISVDEVCKRFFVSRSVLYKLTKPYMPCGVASFIRAEKIKLAKELLSKTSLSASEIAEKLGYSDTNYFLRTFKKETGLPAGKYRKM